MHDDDGGRQGHPRVLLVDDDEQVRPMLVEMLRGAGYEVVEAMNGEDALRKFAEHQLDLVITDLIMPDMEGLGLIRELHSRSPALKIIAMSGGGRGSAADYLEMARAFGATHTLAKPFSKAALLDAVGRVLDRHE